jgi:HSP20 family protein
MLVPQVRSLVPVLNPTWNIDRFLEGFFSDSLSPEAELSVFPAWNVSEDERSFRMEAELPGFIREDLDIQVTGNELRLSGSREKAASEERAKVLRRERFTGTFSRTLRLPVPIDADKVEAVFTDGILSVTLPKSEAALPRKIQVQAATK